MSRFFLFLFQLNLEFCHAMKRVQLSTVCLLILIGLNGFSQTESDERPLLRIDDGVSFAKDSLFLLNLRFRIQNRAGVFSRDLDDFSISEVEARVRRLRLRLDG